MSSLNKAMIIGHLGQEPEVRYTQNNTAVATLSIATNEKWKNSNGEPQEKTEWHRCVAWGRTAEVCQQYLKKGSQVYVEGPIETRSWEDKDGVTRYTTEIKVLNMVMLSSAGQGGGKPASPPHPGQAGKPAKQEPIGSEADLNKSGFDDMDDDLPF